MEVEKSSKKVITRAATILKVLGQFQSGISMSALARESGLPRTTVHRMVSTLEEQDLVITTKDGIRLGPALLILATAAHTDFVALARPFVEILGRRTRETVDVSVFRGVHAISVDQYSSDQELRVVSPVGTAFPVHTTAHGKAILSLLSDQTLCRFLNDDLQPASLPGVNTEALKKDIDHAREHGFAHDLEEHAEGVCGLGFAVTYGNNSVYAISIAVPVQRFKRNKPRLLTELLKAKAEIQAILEPSLAS